MSLRTVRLATLMALPDNNTKETGRVGVRLRGFDQAWSSSNPISVRVRVRARVTDFCYCCCGIRVVLGTTKPDSMDGLFARVGND